MLWPKVLKIGKSYNLRVIGNIKNHILCMPISPMSWLAGLLGILFVRFFLEAISNPSPSGYFALDMPTLLHYGLFFLTVALFLMIFLKIFLPFLGEHAPKIAMIAMVGIWIAPLIDLGLNGVGGSPMVYILDSPTGVLKSFFYLFSSSPAYGTTAGLQIEITIILLAIFSAIYFSTKKFGRAILATLFFYAVLFALCSMPSILAIFAGEAGGPTQVINFLQSSIYSSATLDNHLQSGLTFASQSKLLDTGFNFMIARIFFFLSIAFAYLWFWKTNKRLTLATLKNSRPERVGNYIFIIILGILLALKMFPNISLNWNDYLSLFSLFLSLHFSAMFAICVNDIEDVEIDKITNTSRPLVTNSASVGELRSTSYLFLLASVVAGYLSGLLPFFFILTFTALYYVYSAPPTKFKLIPFFSSFIIGLCFVSTFMAGFYAVYPIKLSSSLPVKLTLGIFVFFFLYSHMRDVKDIEGDRKNGIMTVPVIFGKKVVGVISSIAFLTVPIFLNIKILWLPATLATILTYYFINKEPYSEKPIFGVYLLFILAIGLIYLI